MCCSDGKRKYCLDSFGPDRVVFGGDWPVCTLGGRFVTRLMPFDDLNSVRTR